LFTSHTTIPHFVGKSNIHNRK